MIEQATSTQVKQRTLKNANPINKERQFGQPNGNKQGKGFWKKEQTPRYKLEQMLSMNECEILEIVNNETKPLFDRKIAKSLLDEKNLKGLESMINQVYGPPAQKTELDFNDNYCDISISINGFNNQSSNTMVQ